MTFNRLETSRKRNAFRILKTCLNTIQSIRSEKAQIILPLVKRVPVGLKYSYNFKWSHTLPNRNAGAEFHQEIINSIDSLIPKSLYSRLSWALGPYHFDVFEVISFLHCSSPFRFINYTLQLEMYGEHWTSAWDRIWAKIASYLRSSEIRNASHSQDSDLHPELVRMKKQLNPKSPQRVRDTGSADGFIHVNFMKAIHRFKMFEEPDVLDFFQREATSKNNSRG